MILNILNKIYIRKALSLAIIPFFCMACSGSTGTSSNTANTSDDISNIFPGSLAITSPLSLTATSELPASALAVKFSTASSYVPTYSLITEEIGSILAGSSPSACTFDPENFLARNRNADCYGPEVAYEDHPDSSGMSADGTLPIGDVGMWLEIDPDSSNACAASELDAQMSGVQDQSFAALSGLATMICVANANGITLPGPGYATIVALDAEMNTLGIPNTTFTKANISYDNTSQSYAYELDFSFVPTGATYDVTITMEHMPTSDPVIYSGKFSYLVNDTDSAGNCPAPEITRNASVQYDMSSATEAAIEARSATFCGHDSDGRDSNMIVDPSLKYSASNPTGWGNDFNIFTANFDPADLDGAYAYSWQAGHYDGNSRVFNLALENNGTDAFAYYGYGDDIEITDGSIDGFICNWAGPGNDHTIIEFAQFQDMTVDLSTGQVISNSANITYAPTVSCEYDGLDSFVFDTNADGLLSDEDPALAVINDLVSGQDTDLDGLATIEEEIDDAGYILPTM